MNESEINVVGTGIDDKSIWRPLYDGYAAFYKVPMSDETADTVWSWIHDPAHPVCGLLAHSNGAAVGLAHFRDMPSPLRGATIGFLDDLFVAPAHRGSGVAEALLDQISVVGKSRGWPCFRWITHEENYRGRGFYDRISNRTEWVTYQRDL